MALASLLASTALVFPTPASAQWPSVSLTLSATSLVEGEELTVTANAAAAASVRRIVVQFGEQQISAQPPQSGLPAWSISMSFETTGIGAGPQTVIATAYDDAGLSVGTLATVLIQPTPDAQHRASGTPQPHRASAVVAPVRMYFVGLTLPEHPGKLRLRRVVVIDTNAGEQISVSCRRCSGSSNLGRVAARGPVVTLVPSDVMISNDSQLVLTVTKPTLDGRFKVYAIHVLPPKATPRLQGCLSRSTARRITCP